MIYEAQCKKCNKIHEYIAKVADRENTPSCCGNKTVQGIFTPPQVGAMSWGREKAITMTDGTYIETGQEYKRYMKKHNKIPADEGAQEADRARKRKKTEFENKVTETVKATYDELAA